MSMQATSWVDRITDESNPWLNAMKSEERGDFAGAAMLYLEDAMESLRGERLSKAALSGSCAAMCLDALGFSAQASSVYEEVAELYYENAKRVEKVSVRELMWSLWQAGQFFLAAGEEDKAESVYREYATIAGRVALFEDNTSIRIFEAAGSRRQLLSRDQPAPGDWSALLTAVQRFVNLRRSAIRSAGVPPKNSFSGKRASVKKKQQNQSRKEREERMRGQASVEKSFVSQLG
jgi:hypothetical protein